MKKLKILPKVNPKSYRVNTALDKKQYELTDESQEMRKKIESLIKSSNVLNNC
ncbi:MAG: hypothetical protein ACK4NY_24175 [Spirosomataceae bacterium]